MARMVKRDRREEQLGISEFKRRCLELIETVHREGRELLITKRGRVVARVSPVDPRYRPLRGVMKELLEVTGDIVDTDWSSEWESA